MEGSLSSSIPKPSDDENEEYQKIFSIICGSNIIENDTISNIQYLNGNGLFTCNNVTAFVQKITHNFMITNQNVMPVMPLLDINYNGMISWESFIGALNQWISHSLCFEGLYRRKIGLTMGSRERQIFHHTIANFFLLSGKGLNNTIPKLNSVLELTGSKFDFQLIDLFQDRKVDKAASFKDASDLLQNFDLITKQIASASTILEGIQILNNALRFISRAQSPIELYLSSKLISKLFNFMLNAGIFDQIIVTIVREEDATLQWESLKALSYMVACLKLKDENFDGPQFAQIEQVRNYLFNPEFLNVLWKLAYSTCIEIKEQSLICMGFIAQLNEDSRNYMIVSLQVVSNLSACLSGDRTERYFEAVSFVLSTLAGLLPTNFSLMMDMSVVFAFIEAGYKLITLRDNISILRDGFEILSITLPLVEYSAENKIILERIMQIILQHPNVIVKKFAFATVKEIVEQRESHTKHLIDDKLLVVLNDILTSNEHTLKFLCCRILHILAKKGHSLALFDSKTIPVITKRISDTPQCRWECIKILKTMVSQPSFTSVLVENGVIKLIFSVLSGVREQDDILAEAYNYQGLYLNLPYLIDCINALNTILMNGNISKTGSNLNVYVDHFDKENIERLQLVLEGLFEDKLEVKSQMNRSYLKNYSETSLDQLLMTFLANIRNAHKARDGDLSRSIVSQVSSLLFVVGTNFQEILSTELNTRQAGGSHDIFGDTYLEVRCFSAEEFPNGDNRVLSIPRVIGFSQFIGEIQKKYKQFGTVMIKYFDKAGEILTIDSDEMFQKVLAETLENILNYGPSSDKRLLRVVVKFEDGFANRTDQPKEMQCFECGKKFEVLALYENSDPDELFICYNCKLEQGQMPMPMPMPIGHMTPSPQAGLSRSPYPYPYKF